MGWRPGADGGAGAGPERDPQVPGGPQSGRDPRLAWFASVDGRDALAASGVLAVAADEVAGPERRCPGASGDELVGLARAFAAVESWAAGGKLGVIAEMIRRDDAPRKDCGRHGDLPDDWSPSLRHELALALACSVQSAQATLWLAWEKQARLPGVGSLLDDGTLTLGKARAVIETFKYLTDADAAAAEALIVGQLPGKTYPQVLRLAEQAALTVDPGLAERRREEAQQRNARVTFFRELSGTAGLSGRDLPPDEALAALAAVNARAQAYEDSGAFGDAAMDALRAYGYLDLLKGTSAEDRIATAVAQDAAAEAAEALAWANARAARNAAQTQARPEGTGTGPEPGASAGNNSGTARNATQAQARPGGTANPEPGPGAGNSEMARNATQARARAGETASPEPGAGAGNDNDADHGPRNDPASGGSSDSRSDDNGAEFRGNADNPSADATFPDSRDADHPSDDVMLSAHREDDDSADNAMLPDLREDGEDGDLGDDDGGSHPGGPGSGGPGSGPGPFPGGRAFQPRLPDLIVPLPTLLGLAERPGEIQGFGLLDPALARDLAAAAAASARTQLCVTVTSPEGYAIGHGCARPDRPQRAAPEAAPPGELPTGVPARLNLTVPATALASLAGRAGPWAVNPRPGTGPPGGVGSPGGYGTWTLTLPGGRRFTVRLDPVPVFECDHAYETRAYQPSARLRHLVQVRDGTCTFPTCNRHARESDFEHCQPYDKGGRTCCCNAGARSRGCHRVKQSPDWQVTQPQPGWHHWRTPSGRVHVQGPKRYPALRVSVRPARSSSVMWSLLARLASAAAARHASLLA